MLTPILNKQPPERGALPQINGALEVFDVWRTIQGEGPRVGQPAMFVRLAGCNLQCPMCDTDYTSKRITVAASDLLTWVSNLASNPSAVPIKLIVMTGGEPFRQDFSEFARLAVHNGFTVQVESNGTLWRDELWPARFEVVISPKTTTIREELKRYVAAYKYIIEFGHVDPDDGLPTSVLGNAIRPARPPKGMSPEMIFVQPADTTNPLVNDKNLWTAVNSCMRYGYRLSVQVHKIVGLP